METFKNKIIPVIFGINGICLTKNEIDIIKNNKIYGFIFFKRNILNLSQFKILINHIKTLSQNNPVIMIDHEGGRVNRFSNLFDQQKFSAKYFGKLYNKDKKKFAEQTKYFIKFNIKIFKYLGINTIAYPVADLTYKKTHKVIGDRSFSNDPFIVNKLSRYFIHKYQSMGINCISKHVPGHGLSVVDSHYNLPIVQESYDDLNKKDLLCFKNLNSKFMMTAHIKYSSIDKKIATYSNKINNIIRNRLKFTGLIMTDDICMKALNQNIKYKTLQPLIAGYNLILHCNGNINEMKKIVSIIKKWKNQ